MNILAKFFLLIASSQISDQIEDLGIPYEILPYPMKPFEGRVLPADLKERMYNKTDEELAYEDCMDAYILCRSSQKSRPDFDSQICSVDKRTSSKGTFASVCEMIYENCKLDSGAWGYFHDGPCQIEFVADPEKPTQAPAPPENQTDETKSEANSTRAKTYV